MIRKRESMDREIIEKMKGGNGVFSIEKIMMPDEIHNKGRLFVRGVLAPGDSVGYHVHENDMEICYFIEGEGLVTEDGREPVKVGAGDCHAVDSGHGHMICNTGNVDLVYLALVLYV